MNELQFQLLIDHHRPATRQGPGGKAETRQAMALAGLDRSRRLKIADIGCGTGASTVLLAEELDAEITAVDFLPGRDMGRRVGGLAGWGLLKRCQ